MILFIKFNMNNTLALTELYINDKYNCDLLSEAPGSEHSENKRFVVEIKRKSNNLNH